MDYTSQSFEIMVDYIKEIIDTIIVMNKTIIYLENRIKELEKNKANIIENKNLDFVEICNNNDFEEI